MLTLFSAPMRFQHFISNSRYGNMVAFFRYSPVDILSVNLPPSILDFNCHNPQEWLKRVAIEVCYFINFMETMFILCILYTSFSMKEL